MPTERETLLGLIGGFRLSQAIHVIAMLRIPNLIADAPRSANDLADELGCNRDALYRLLRFVAATGVLHEDDERRISLTPVSELLRDDVPGSLADWARFLPRPYLWQPWSLLLDTVRTGDNAFRSLHGVDVWDYRRERPEETAAFDAAMTAQTLGMNESVATGYDFGRFARIVDVGGGRGALIRAILDAHPHVSGVLFDQDPVVANAPTHERLECVAGDFFREVPAGADAYLLKWVIHDWEDEEARAILQTVRRAMPGTGVVLLVERVLPPPNEGADTKVTDLQMLMITGGRERTRDEYARLFAAAGLRYADETRAAGYAIIEASPA
jgi:hypothetical protein